LIFSPKNRQALIQKTWKNELERYITGIIRNNKHKLLAIGLMPDPFIFLLVIKYVLNQEQHHKKKTFKDEYLRNTKKK